MSSDNNISIKIQELLLTNSIMSLQQLRSEFSGRSRSSLFRDLKKLNLITSYSHTGQYHALNTTAKFDENGLWFFQGVRFSRHGTLKETLTQIITQAEMGMTHKEMKTLFHVDVQKPLINLVKSNTVTRQLLPSRIYVYLSADESTADNQFQRRLAISRKVSPITLPPESMRIEILVEVIHGRTFDEAELGTLLRKRGIIIKDNEVAYVLAYYDIKKKRILK